MYTLGIPDKQKRRALGYLKQNWIEFEERPSGEGFFELRFPDIDEDEFKNVVMKLKKQGVTTIGADEKLTEKNIMKLTDLITEEFAPNLNEQPGSSVIEALKNILQSWQTKQYADDRSRWEEYYMDIEELVQDFEENTSIDRDDVSDLPVSQKFTEPLAEQKLRKVIRKIIRQ